MACLWIHVLFMSRQLAGGLPSPWACRVAGGGGGGRGCTHHLPPSQGAEGTNEGLGD